ncbi:MAG: PEP-CTERM sorting domain-containing protein [Sulfuritalea sp.]|nr:PEP-CTERM sorting domain-containing protein [Sulfuritalea sp.]
MAARAEASLILWVIPTAPVPTTTSGIRSAPNGLSFTNFTNHTLSGYDWNGTTAEHKADSTALQLAIWYLEGEISSTVNSSVYNLYTSNSRATGWVAEANQNATGWIGQVRVLNLLREGTLGSGVFNTVAQDQLYLAPIPEPETYAMMLAGLGLIGFVAGRRRRKLS